MLAGKAGHDIVTSSGDTLLGADDKAGVAEIMAAVAHLAAHPELPRPTLRVGFTPDEEIGEGATLLRRRALRRARAPTRSTARELGELQDETFTAVEVDRHDPRRRRPSRLGDGQARQRRPAGRPRPRRAAARAHARGDRGPRGLHPPVYEVDGDGRHARRSARSCATSTTTCSQQHVALLRRDRRGGRRAPSRARGSRSRSRRSTRTCARYLEAFPEVVERPRRRSAPKGSSRARRRSAAAPTARCLSAMGLPTPNLFTGGHEYHSLREWASVQDMAAAAATIVRLAEVWAGPGLA